MDCPYIPDIGYGEFRQRLQKKTASGERYPFAGSLEITFRCNLRCQHCFVSHGHTGIPSKQELSLAEIQRILGEIADEGCLWFLLTGGEPLMRSDFVDIYTYAKQKGLLITLFTNGTKITPRIADFLAEYRPLDIEISVYGYTQQTYELVTGIPGSHARMMRGIELLQERNLPFRLKSVLMTLNKHELWEMKTMAEELGVNYRYDSMINAGVDGDNSPLSLRIDPNEIVQLELQDPEQRKGWQDFQERFMGGLPDQNYLYSCGAGIQSFHIDPYGQLSLCIMARHQSYDLRKGSFSDGWNNFLRDVRFQPPQGDYPCNQCELLPMCGQCPGWAYFESGDQEKPVDFLCQVAHLRAKAFLKTPENNKMLRFEV